MQQPAASGAKPKIAGWIFGNGIDALVGQTISAAIRAHDAAALGIPLGKPVHCSGPGPPAAGELDRANIRIAQPIPLRQNQVDCFTRFIQIPPQPCCAALGPNPHASLRIDGD